MKEFPPYYISQKIVANKTCIRWKKGDVFTVLDIYPQICDICKKDSWTVVIKADEGGGYCYTCFTPIQENFQHITYKAVLEKEEKLIGVN